MKPDSDIANQLIERFEHSNFEPGQFGHETHVQVAWVYLNRYGLPEAARKVIDGLKQLTKKIGAESKYHETITWFFLCAIHERVDPEVTETWSQFAEKNQDLLTDQASLIERHYSKERLGSPESRARFLLPDRAA